MEKLFAISSNIDSRIGLAALAIITFAKLASLILKKSKNPKYILLDKIVNFSFVIVMFCIILIFYMEKNIEISDKETPQKEINIDNKGDDPNNTVINGNKNQIDNSRTKVENHNSINNVNIDVNANKSNIKINGGSGTQNIKNEN